MKIMNAKYAGRCETCGGSFDEGAEIGWSRSIGAVHSHCIGVDPNSPENQEYSRGIADGERRQAEKAIYGEAFAEELAVMDEFNSYWKYGEDY